MMTCRVAAQLKTDSDPRRSIDVGEQSLAVAVLCRVGAVLQVDLVMPLLGHVAPLLCVLRRHILKELPRRRNRPAGLDRRRVRLGQPSERFVLNLQNLEEHSVPSNLLFSWLGSKQAGTSC